MPILDYPEHLVKCKNSLERQSAKLEIIISEHQPEKYIRKNYLLNEGFKKARGNIIWHCDADFTLTDPDALKNAAAKLEDVSCPVFKSIKGHMKPADGGPLIRREILEHHGPLDESITGINFTTFPFLRWCIYNARFKVDSDFIIKNNSGGRLKNKINWKHRAKLKNIYREVISNEKFQVPDMRQ
jgi:hypothetical protein